MGARTSTQFLYGLLVATSLWSAFNTQRGRLVATGARLVTRQSACADDEQLIQWPRYRGVATSDLIWLSVAQIRWIEPHFVLSRGVPGFDDLRVISGITFVIRIGQGWREAPKYLGSHKATFNRFTRWRQLGVFKPIFAALAAKAGKPDQLMIDALPSAKTVLGDRGRDADWFR